MRRAIILENIPQEFKLRKQWVLWKTETRNGKPTKVPYQPNHQPAKTNDPQTFSPFITVVERYKQDDSFDGIGFVFTKSDPFLFIDFDHCRAKNGSIDPPVIRYLKLLNSYTEISQSGQGIHVIVKAKLPEWSGNRKDNIEIYDNARYAVMTGERLDGYSTVIEERQQEVEKLCRKLFGEPQQDKGDEVMPTATNLSDDQIIELCSNARNGEKFKRLFYDGVWKGLYPSQSEADLALASLITFYTKNPEQIERIIRRSKLWDKKWEEREDYPQKTIEKAIKSRVSGWQKEGNHNPAIPSVRKPPKSFSLTDIGNGERLAYYYGDRLRYCDDWYVWNGKYWEQNNNEVVELAKLTVRRIYSEAEQCDDENMRKKIAEHAVKSESAFRVKAMLEMAKSDPNISFPRERFDSDPDLLNVSNGVIDLRTGKLLKQSQDYYMTKIANVEYDPEAQSELWENFLEKITGGNPELKDFLQRAVGYSLTGRTDEEKLFFIYGPTATGKSSFIEAIKAVMGKYAMTSDFESFLKHKDMFRTVRNDIAILDGARLVVSIEVDKGKRMAEGLIKMLTGGDTIRARYLYKESFEFVPQMKLWLVANHKPKIDASDTAMWRRILVIPFDHVIPEEERDPQVKIMLKTDPDIQKAILAWGVKGAVSWHEKGLTMIDLIKQATNQYKAEMDIITAFLQEYTERDVASTVTKNELYDRYVAFCKDANEIPEGRISFGRQLKEMGYQDDRDNFGKSIWKGIKLIF